MNKKKVNETQLRTRCIDGDRDASGDFVRHYSYLVYRTVQYTLQNRHVAFIPDDVRDLHNTVFLKLFENNCKKLAQFKGRNGCSLATWVRLVALRIVLNELRRRGMDSITGRRQLVGIDYIKELEDDQISALAILEKADRIKLLKSGVQGLPPRYRLFYRLHFEQELSVKEVARTMQISVDNVYTVKHRTIKKLKVFVAENQKMNIEHRTSNVEL